MAKIKVDAFSAFNMYDLDFSQMYSGAGHFAARSKLVVTYSLTDADILIGSGFQYDWQDVLIGGTVKTFIAMRGSTSILSVKGMKLSAAMLGAAAETASKADDLDVMEAALSKRDTFKGGHGDDTFATFAGNDTLYGRLGNDDLEGGMGKDVFVFDTWLHKRHNVDSIRDFSHDDDTIWLDEDVFLNAGYVPWNDKDQKVALSHSAFWANRSGKAHDEDDRIIYDKTNGHLYYDADGTRAGKAVLFADLEAHLKLDASDFLVIA